MNKPKKKINVNGHEYSRIMLTVGKDYEGAHIQKPFYGKTLTEANKKKDEYKEQVAVGVNPKLSKQSLSQAMFIWLWNVEYPSSNKSSTFERYEGIYRNWVQDSDIGMIIFEDITSLTIQTHINKLSKEGKTYSQIKNLLKLLKKFFYYAVREGYISQNSCVGVKIPKDDEEELDSSIDDDFDDFEEKFDAFTEEEIKTILNSIPSDEMIRYIVAAAVLTGLREGELLALDRNKDIKNSKIRINKTVKSVKVFESPKEFHYELKITRPKSKKSNRIVPFNETLEKEFKQLYKLISLEKLKLGQNYKDIGLLFPSENGNYIDVSNLLKAWKKVLINAGIEYKKFHALRDTYASLLVKKGTSIETISRLLGHSSIKITEKYIHVDKETKFEEVKKLNGII